MNIVKKIVSFLLKYKAEILAIISSMAIILGITACSHFKKINYETTEEGGYKLECIGKKCLL